MAYISAEKTRQIREELKLRFPKKQGWKFSVKKDHGSLRIAILEAPVRFCEKDNGTLNHYYPEQYENSGLLKKITGIANGDFLAADESNYDNSDSMTDYFDVGWYISIKQGDWDKPFVVKNKMDLI